MLRCAARKVVTPRTSILASAHRSLAAKVVVCGDESAFEAAKNNPNGSVIYFTATWCGPCKMISPYFEKLAAGAKDSNTFLKVDVDDEAEIAQAAGISAMPTFQFYKSGQMLDKIVGADIDKLTAGVKSHLA